MTAAMQVPLYVRYKGRVLGPFDWPALEQQIVRGQLSRLHEVSEDGVTWIRASRYPNLFEPAQTSPPLIVEAEPAARPVASAASASAVEGDDERPARAAPAPQSLWYYAIEDGPHQGPISFEELQAMARRGELEDCAAVWSEGLADWVSPDNVPGLMAARSTETPRAAAVASLNITAPVQAEPQQVSLEACRILAATRPWVLFCAVLGFLYALVLIIVAVVGLVRAGGSGAARPVLVSIAMADLVVAALVGFGACLLLAFGSRIGALVMYKSSRHLEQVLEASRFFWQYVGIVLIVMLTSAIVLFVWFLAVVETL